jgi:signal transduction histidine kinase
VKRIQILVDNQPHSNDQLIYQSVFLLMDDAVIVLNPEHRITHLNPAAETLLQISQEAIGQILHDVMSSQHQIELSLESLPDDPIELQLTDETRHYQLTHKRIPKQLGHIVIFKDVTNEQVALAKVEQLLSAYSDYAHTVGHDVKSPLGVVIGYSNMLQSELEPETEAHLFADEIFNVSMRILYICNELVLLSELHNPDVTSSSPINLNSVLDNAMRRFTKDATSQNITMTIDDSMPITQGNPPWIEEVLVNYLRYAIHDSVPTTVEIGADKQDDGMVRMWVKHDGQALSPDKQISLFDTTLNLEDIRAEGHGLGMGIAKLIIERLGGTVGIEDEQTIYFTLPAENEDK